MTIVVENVWGWDPSSHSTKITQGARRTIDSGIYFERSLSDAEAACHRHAILVQHYLLSGRTHTALGHYNALVRVATALISSHTPHDLWPRLVRLVNRSCTMNLRRHELTQQTITNLRKRALATYTLQLDHAVGSNKRSTPGPRDKAVVVYEYSVKRKPITFLVQVLQQWLRDAALPSPTTR